MRKLMLCVHYIRNIWHSLLTHCLMIRVFFESPCVLQHNWHDELTGVRVFVVMFCVLDLTFFS